MKKINLLFIIILMCSIASGSLIEDALFISRLYEDGFYDLALREISRLESQLENDRYSHQILAVKADILLIRNEITEAKSILLRLNSLSLNPSLKAQVILSLARVERSLNNFTEAYDLIQIFLARFPDNESISDVQLLLGEVLFEQGMIEEAETVFYELHRNHPSIHSVENIIKINIYRQNLTAAESALKELKTNFPRNHLEYQQYLLSLLNAYENQADYQKILSLTNETIEPLTVFTEPIIQKRIVANINLRNFEEAERQLLTITEDTASVNYFRGLIHKERGEFQLALPIFRELADSRHSELIRTMSFFNMVQIIARDNTTEAYDLLLNFLVANPNQDWEGDIIYQLGFIEFQNGNYDKALEYTNQSLTHHLNNVNKSRAVYLKGELEFLLGYHLSSYQTFSENFDLIPEIFRDETVFKMGLNNYFLSNRELAYQYFNRLIREYPSSSKIGLAYYYLGEIQLFSDLDLAKTYYQQALSNGMEEGVVNLRLAYVEFLRNDYNAAINIISRVPNTSEYLFDKNLIIGVILIAQRQFIQALDAFRQAELNAQDRESVEFIWSRQALLHYNLRNYDTAQTIYSRLAEHSDTPGRYILLAAGAAFNADNFGQAIDLYREFIDNHPEHSELSRAQIGLANSYFNIGLFDMAIDVWQNLVNENERPEIVDAALKGLQDSYLRTNRVALFSEFLLLAIFRSHDKDFLLSLYDFKARYEYEQRHFNSSIATINQMLIQFPEQRDNLEIMIMLANNNTWTNRFEEADQIYIDLSQRFDDPLIFYEWGHIKAAQGDNIAAVRRFKMAVENSRNDQYWLTLLEKMIELKDTDFMRYFNEFAEFASPHILELGTLNLIDWYIHTNNHTDAIQKANELITSNNSQVRASATFKRGMIYYDMREYDDALTSFIRITYFFTEFPEIRTNAELYMAKIYVLRGDRTRGTTIFNNIRNSLSPQQIADFNAML